MPKPSRHYERAFESLLRSLDLPYLKVDDARRALLPQGARLEHPAGASLKTFDHVVYGRRSLLVEVKGRKGPCPARLHKAPRFENWTTRDDLQSLLAWERLFGEGFLAALAFVYAFEEPPTLAADRRVLEQDGLWFVVLAAPARDYMEHARTRSPRWGTVSVPTERFRQISTEIDQLCALPAAAAAVG